MSEEPRRVRIVRDQDRSALWVIRCAEPCDRVPAGRVWCQNSASAGGATYRLPPHHPGVCWLASSLSENGAHGLARGLGYHVEDSDP